VIGSAFTAIVNGIVTGIFNPLIALLFNAQELATAGTTIRIGDNEQTLSYGLVISAVIQFLLIAIVIYFGVVTPMNYFKKVAFAKRNQEPEEEKPAPPSEVELLGQIRDLLQAAQVADHGRHSESTPASASASAPPTASVEPSQ
jgi:large conductance mechanosensitive channel